MARFKIRRGWLTVYLACIFTLLITFGIASSARAQEQTQDTEAYCLSCHGNPDLSMELPSGETLSLYISPDTLSHSVHSPLGIECQACHTEITTYPHPELAAQNQRELSLAFYEACAKCHPDNYDKAQDSVHAQVAAAGNQAAPVCTDCHGAHDVQPPDQPRTEISTTCGKCHSAISEEYLTSIHGEALIQEDNPDVPVCTDCHGVHNIQDPRTPQFRIESPEMCAGCHADAELMAKYGLSADVYSLYDLSWHGVDVSVYKANWPTIWHESAVCTDCHGVHNIRATGDPASSVNPANLLSTCQKCHPGVGPNWTGAWTGHNQISLERTPLVYYTDAFYATFAPIVLWGSVIYVVLKILHMVIERTRRSLR